MAALFDKNGNATETHIATVSGFDATTGEHLATYEVRIFEGTGIPSFSTLTPAPAADVEHVACWTGSQWQQVIDLRGTAAYEKETGKAVAVKSLGPLSDELTSSAPATDYDKWDGSAWVTDIDAQTKAAIKSNEQMRAALLATANAEISWRQDAVDAEIATPEETAGLTAWKKYRVLLMRVDAAAPAWPALPVV